MRDEKLPLILIKLSLLVEEFTTRFYDVAIKSGVEKAWFDHKKLIIELPIKQIHEQWLHTYVQLIPTKDEHLVRVDISADEWGAIDLTYDLYVETASVTVKPLLQRYNSIYKNRYRLRIQKKSDLAIKLPLQAQRAFENFVKGANRTSLHPLDYDTFYTFVYWCHAKKAKVTHDNLLELLVDANFSEDQAEHLADIFYHCRKMLEPRLRHFRNIPVRGQRTD